MKLQTTFVIIIFALIALLVIIYHQEQVNTDIYIKQSIEREKEIQKLLEQNDSLINELDKKATSIKYKLSEYERKNRYQ